MRNLNVSNQKDLQKLKKLFKEEYKEFFKQDLKTSKVEAFMARLWGVKDFNTLLASFPDEKKLLDWSAVEHFLYDENRSINDKLDMMREFIPPTLDIEMNEQFDHGTFNVNKINRVAGNPIADEDSTKELKEYFKNLDENVLNKLLVNMNNKDVLVKFFDANGFDSFNYEAWTDSLHHIYMFYRKSNYFMENSDKEILFFSLDFLYFCQEGLISDYLVYQLDDLNLVSNIEKTC